MNLIVESLRRAAVDLMQPRVISVMFLPMLAALLVWGILLLWFGSHWVIGLESFLTTLPRPDWMSTLIASWLTGFAVYVVMALLLIPAIYVTALFVTSLLFMPLLISAVSNRHFPKLTRLNGGTTVGSTLNGLIALVLYLLVWVLTLPFWLLAPLGFAVSIFLNAWLNQRLFMYDALAEHASVQELQDLRGSIGWEIYLLAAILGLLHFVPVINFFAPVYMGLAFTHYGLTRLEHLRAKASI
jgi:hypothetical protein